MDTKFEKRVIVFAITFMMSLSMACSGGMTVYAEENVSGRASWARSEGFHLQGKETGTLSDNEEGAGEDTKTFLEEGNETPETFDGKTFEETAEDPEEETDVTIKPEARITENPEDYEYSVLGDGTVEITGYTGAETKVTIPEQLDGKMVSSIGNSAFAGRGLIELNALSVVKVGNYAFSECKGLKTATFGAGLTSIGEYAFYKSGIQKLNLSGDSKIKRIENYAFAYSGLTELNIPSVKEIGDWAFSWCKQLGNFAIVEGPSSFGEGAFAHCSSLRNFTWDDGTSSIGRYAFFNLARFIGGGKISMDESSVDIGEKAFGYFEVGGEVQKEQNYRIYGVVNSTLQTYAKENGFQFYPILTIIPTAPGVTDYTYIIGSAEGVTIKCTGEVKDFVNVFMDDVEVDRSNYTLAEGSTLLTFTAKYLNTLSVGEHKVTLNYTYGSVDTILNILSSVNRPGTGNGNGSTGSTGGASGNGSVDGAQISGGSRSPKTGDDAAILLWLLMALFAAGTYVITERKRHHSI